MNKNLSGPKYFWTTFVFDSKFFAPKIYLQPKKISKKFSYLKIFVDPKYIYSKSFRTACYFNLFFYETFFSQIFLIHNFVDITFFAPKQFWTHIFFWKEAFTSNYFDLQCFLPIFSDPTLFASNVQWTQIVLGTRCKLTIE